MKREKAIAALLVFAATVLSCVVPSFATIPERLFPNMPLRDEFLADENTYFKWYQTVYDPILSSIENDAHDVYTDHFANLWFMYTDFSDTAEWPDEYLAEYKKAVDDAALEDAEDIEVKFNGYKWANGQITVDASVLFELEYTWEYHPIGWYLRCNYGDLMGADPALGVSLTAVVSNKTNGSLVHLGRDLDDGTYLPDINEEILGGYGELAEAPQDYSIMTEVRRSITFDVPDYFDPDKHQITVYFCRGDLMGLALPEFSDAYDKLKPDSEIVPDTGSEITDGEKNYNMAMLWSEFARLDQEIPGEYRDYYSDLLNSPRDAEAYLKITELHRFRGSDGILVSLEGFARLRETVYDAASDDKWEVVDKASASVCAMVTDRETGVPLGFDNFSFDCQMTVNEDDPDAPTEIKDLAVRLPDHFDPEKHRLVFYLAIDNYNYFDTISEPVEADIASACIAGSGDANGNGNVNLSDAALMLQYAADWEIEHIDTYCADMNMDESVNMLDITILLQVLAEWENVNSAPADYINRYLDEADAKYGLRRAEYLKSVCNYYTSDSGSVPEHLMSEWENEMKREIWISKLYGFSYEELEAVILGQEFVDPLCVYKKWEQDDLISVMKEAYDSEYYPA